MAKYNPWTKKIDMEGVDPESPWGSSLWIHENVHKHQHIKEGRKYVGHYKRDNWRYERPAYYAQICFLIQLNIKQDRFPWIRDILEMGYNNITPNDVEELLNELQI